MPALPADVAKYTSEGVVITSPTDPAVSNTIKANHVDARGGDDNELEMFFVSAVVGQAILNERFALLSQGNMLHEGIEVEESLGLGDTIPVAPTVPCFTAVDETREINVPVRTRAYAHDTGTDRFSVEVLS